jgi:hypothetical protein
MRIEVLTLGIFLGFIPPALKAGMVATLSPAPEASGKVSLTSDAIHVETSASPVDIKLSDVLEADFSDAPFHLDSFTTIGVTGTGLPANWKAQDIKADGPPGSITCKDGTFTLLGNGEAKAPKVDQFFFAGQPWTGDGQWTARVQELGSAADPQAVGGLMLRDSLEPGSPLFAAFAATNGFVGGEMRLEAKKNLQGRPRTPLELPIWLRLTRYGPTIDLAMSGDGKEWAVIDQAEFKTAAPNPWIGLFADSRKHNVQGRVVIDQVSFTPLPCAAVILPPGVILQDGSFLAGSFDHLDLDPASPEVNGAFSRNGKPLAIPRSNVAVVALLPGPRAQLAAAGAQIGLLMKNGDFLTGTFQGIDRGGVHLTSELLGPVTYNGAEVQACLLQPVQPPAAAYEVRLRDGSIIRASGVSVAGDQVSISEVSGLNLDVARDEIAQFRSGATQSLLEFPFKATPPAPAVGANPAPEPPPVECWQGNNQEEVLSAPAGRAVEFPLAGTFSGMSMRIALASDAPPNAQATIRILADGTEIGRTPPFKAGEPPRWLRSTLQQPKTVTLEADSTSPGTKVLFIDPTLIRAH